MTTSSAMMHVRGLGASNSFDETRISLRTALAPYASRLRDSWQYDGIALRMAQSFLGAHPTRNPLNAVFAPDRASQSLLLGVQTHDLLSVLAPVQRLADCDRGDITRPQALQHMHSVAERLIGSTAGPEEAKRKVRACILRLHPDKCRGLTPIIQLVTVNNGSVQVDRVEMARATLLEQYIMLLEMLERPDVAPYIAGPVAFDGRQALATLSMAGEQRLGRQGVKVAIGATACLVAATFGTMLYSLAMAGVLIPLALGALSFLIGLRTGPYVSLYLERVFRSLCRAFCVVR